MKSLRLIIKRIILAFTNESIQLKSNLVKAYKIHLTIGLLISVVILFSQCHNIKEKALHKTSNPKVKLASSATIFRALPETFLSPKTNILSDEKVNLGRLLFFDPILSGDRDIACATCHHPSHGYAEFRDLSIGTSGRGLGDKRSFSKNSNIPIMKRNSNSILNSAFSGIDTAGNYTPEFAKMFWDSRVFGLENQAIEPLIAVDEMKGTNYERHEILKEIENRLSAIPEYVEMFSLAFDEENPINDVNIGKAIAAFERSLLANNSRFDQYLNGDDEAISKAEKLGFRMFQKAGCANCHFGPMLSDFTEHTLGIPENEKLTEYDKGLYEDYAFRTPSLRNLRFTAPYMHNGTMNTLQDVLEFYEDTSNGRMRHDSLEYSQIDTFIQQINLSVKEIGPIISFLNTLNDPNFDKTIPESVPSQLQVAGNIIPITF